MRKHTKTINSFVDEKGNNHFIPCVREITMRLGDIAMMIETSLGYIDPESEGYKHLETAQKMLSEFCLPELLSSDNK